MIGYLVNNFFKRIKTMKEGGLKMIHLQSFIKSMKLSWIRKMMTSNSNWIATFQDTQKINLNEILNFGNDYLKQTIAKVENIFWREVLTALYALKSLQPENAIFKPIWYNPKVIVAGQSVYYKSWYANSVSKIIDILDTNGNFLSYHV